MENKLREISACSNNKSNELNYKEKYWFHQWINSDTALVENSEGFLLEAKYTEFKFLTKDKK